MLQTTNPGACDFSVFNEKYLEITANIPDITDYTYKVNYDVYTVSYNVLKIVSGMGSLSFGELILCYWL